MTNSSSSLQVGHAVADITPPVGITLSGFAARCDCPSTGIDDPLSVHAIAFAQEDRRVLLLAFDLLGLGPELTDEITRSIREIAPNVSPILCCTHTHSAPATIELLGCGKIDRGYWDLVVRASRDAANRALANLRPAKIRYTTRDVRGISYNRRHVLDSGRVIMTPVTGDRVAKVGPTWDELFLARIEDASSGVPIVGCCAWAAHPAVVCTQNVSADFPGELRRRLETRHGFPFVYLQGACADINLPGVSTSRERMLANVDRLMEKIGEVAWDRSVKTGVLRQSEATVELPYQSLPSRDELRATAESLESAARTGVISVELPRTLSNILNMQPTTNADEKMRHVCAALTMWARRWSDRYETAPRACTMNVAALELGDLFFPIFAAEVFCETGLAVRDALPNRVVVPVAYASPLIGYLPTDAAIAEGGYESAHAYRFFGQPAAFAPGAARGAIDALLRIARR